MDVTLRSRIRTAPLEVNDVVVTTAVGAVCSLCALFSAIPSAGLIALVTFLVYLAYLLVRRPQLYLLYLYVFFNIVINVLGAAVCEYSSLYLNELRVDAHFVGGLPLLILGRWAFVAVLVVGDMIWNTKTGKQENRSVEDSWILRLAALGVALVCTAMFASIATKPAFLLHVDRFTYKANYLPKLVDRLSNVMIFGAIVPILAIRRGDRMCKVLGTVGIVAYLLFLVWAGHKFGYLFYCFVFALVVYYDDIVELMKRTKVQLLSSVLVVMAMLAMFAFISTKSTFGVTSPVEYFSSRLAQQGELWWRTYEVTRGEFHPEDFTNEIDALFMNRSSPSEYVGSKDGLWGIMYLTAPAEVVTSKILSGSFYTECGHAVMYRCFGEIGVLLFDIVLALIISVIGNCLLWATRYGRVIDTLLLTKLFVASWVVLSQFALTGLFTGEVNAVAYVLFFVEWLYRGNGVHSFRLQNHPRLHGLEAPIDSSTA